MLTNNAIILIGPKPEPRTKFGRILVFECEKSGFHLAPSYLCLICNMSKDSSVLKPLEQSIHNGGVDKKVKLFP